MSRGTWGLHSWAVLAIVNSTAKLLNYGCHNYGLWLKFHLIFRQEKKKISGQFTIQCQTNEQDGFIIDHMVFDVPLEFKLICQSTGHLSWVWPHHPMSDQRHIVNGIKLIVILNCTYVWMWVQVVVCLFVLALRQARDLSGVWPASCSTAAGIASFFFFSRVIILIHVYWDVSVLGSKLLKVYCVCENFLYLLFLNM